MKRWGVIMLSLVMVLGCTAGGDIDQKKAEIVAGKVIEIGMSIDEVIDLLGAPDSASPGKRSLEGMPEMRFMYGDAVILTKDGRVVEVMR